MGSLRFLLLAAALLGWAVNGLILEQRDNPAVFKVDLIKRTNEVQTLALKTRLMRRSGEVGVTDNNYQDTLLYVVQLFIGTPPQSTLVQLDTGSSDLVVETDSSDIYLLTVTAKSLDLANCLPDVANSSSTYQYLNSDLSIQYGGGDGATGDYALDVVSVGGAVIQNLQLGMMYKSTILEGILGVSFTQIEGQVINSGKAAYSNLPVLLVTQGYIASRAFSLWTNDDRSTSGTLLFGGVDTSKYYGNLVTVDPVPSGFDSLPGVVDFTIPLNGVTGTDGNGNAVAFSGGSTAVNVLMDSGTTITALPDALVASIWDFVGATAYAGSPSSAYIPCSAGSSTTTINLKFTGPTIAVPLSQLVIFPDGSGTCDFGISKAGPNGVIIGDTVLSSIYVVYDLDNKQISLASTVFNATTSNVVQILAGPGGVPNDPGVGGTMTTTSKTTTSTTTTLTTTTSTTSSKPTVTTTMLKCNADNCLRAFKRAAGASAFCATYTGGVGALPTYVSACSSSASRISSACTCLLAGPSSPTTTTSMTTTKAPICNADNCLRAIERATAKSFCNQVLSNGVASMPTAIANGCATLTSRVSSGCSCYIATAT